MFKSYQGVSCCRNPSALQSERIPSQQAELGVTEKCTFQLGTERNGAGETFIYSTANINQSSFTASEPKKKEESSEFIEKVGLYLLQSFFDIHKHFSDLFPR